MGMALDELKDTDDSETFEGLTVVVEKELHEQIGGVEVDYKKSPWGEGFDIRATNVAGGDECGGGCC